MAMGVRRPLEQADLWDVSTRDQSSVVSARFQEALEMHHHSIARAAWAVHGRRFVAVGVLKLVHDIVMLSIPFWLQQLLVALEEGASRGVSCDFVCGPMARSHQARRCGSLLQWRGRSCLRV